MPREVETNSPPTLERKAPLGIKILRKVFAKVKIKRREGWYKGLVLVLTFLAYTSYHLSKRPISVVKGTLSPNCTVTEANNTCKAWHPFDSPSISKELFSALDSAFLFTYAIAMFASGYVAEHTSIRYFLGFGMILTGLFTSLFGLGYFLHVHHIYFYVVSQALSGLFQSTGWPCVVACVGNWFGEGKRGVIMGIWNSHVSVGNIAGSAIAGIWSGKEWGLSFIVPGIIIASLGLFILMFLVSDPAYVGIKRNKTHLIDAAFVRLDEDTPEKIRDRITRRSTILEKDSLRHEGEAIGFFGALKIPGVVEYSLCLFFAKLVSYTFLYWLPFYLQNRSIGHRSLTSEESADVATFFDVGAIIGGVAAGFVSDKTQCSGITTVSMLLLAAPSLFVYETYGSTSLKVNIALMIVAGIFVNGPYALITTAVSASLGSHQSLRGKTKAMATVTAIIDGTGSIGAAIGPMLCGLISANHSWNDVFYFLIGSVFLAALLLMRQVWFEIKIINSIIRSRKTKTVSGNPTVNSESEALLGNSADSMQPYLSENTSGKPRTPNVF